MEADEAVQRKSLGQVSWGVGLLTVLRVSLGVLFIISSVSKLQYPDLFVDAVLKVGILPDSLGRVFGTVLPWTELFIGCSLILGIFTAVTAGITALLVLSFIIANIYSMFGPYAGEPCDCLGRLVRLSHPAALTVDFGMLFAAGLLLYMRDKSETIGVWRLLRSARLPRAALYALGAVIIAAAMTVSFFVIPAPKSNLELAIDDALEDDEVVVLLLYSGNPFDFSEEIVMINALRVEYSTRVYMLPVGCDEDPEALELFEVGAYPTVLLISDKNRDGYVIYGRFGGVEDREALVAAIDELLSQRV